jgi:hypothetical protein
MGFGGISIWQIIILIFMFVIGVLPWIMALLSKHVSGGKKFIWFLLSFFFSWLGYAIYYFLVVRELKNQPEAYISQPKSPDRQEPY